ncbi:MAG: GntR family transcriptional regulator [Treponema sp.]|jgi:DNA-binding LacI/PurR family transcriptional regulator|nr:GntR family transcriptional regulator [Treponema sp.]
MPKKVADAFFHILIRVIKNDYQPGDKFLSIRELSAKYQVSVQTVQKAIKRLEEYGYISIRKKAGITVNSLRPLKKLDGYKVAVVSAREEPHFIDSFLRGIRKTADTYGISVQHEFINEQNVQHLRFGEYLCSLGADGIIALNFRNSALPFYHVLREGVDIVTDIILDELPILPAVQTDNLRHSREAGRIFLEQGYRRILALGYYPPARNRRFDGIAGVVKEHGKELSYICLSDADSVRKIDKFFHHFDRYSAVFSADYSANYIAGAKYVQYKIPVRNDNFLVYDCEDDFFTYSGLGPVRKVGPSMITLGAELCKTLITKQETGAYPLPLQRKV